MKMQVTIDAAGRVVIPKAVRDRLRLKTGTELALEADEDTIVLKPMASGQGCLGHRDGVLLLTAELHGPVATVQEVRHGRSAQIWGAAEGS